MGKNTGKKQNITKCLSLNGDLSSVFEGSNFAPIKDVSY